MSPETSVGADDVDLDALSLEQALIDFEIANERVRDLTYRLVATTHAMAELQERIRVSEERLSQLERERAELESTKAYKLARRVWAVREALGI
jgi:hypothetical protein